MTSVAVVGTGNVGSALLLHLLDVPNIERILVMNLEDDWSTAAIMDAASAKPAAASRLVVSHYSELGRCDVIAVTSGAQMKSGQVGTDVLHANTQIMDVILDQASLKPRAVLISLATPVDDITVHIQARYGLPRSHVIGFGGDLDHNRLAFVLRKHGLPTRNIGWWASTAADHPLLQRECGLRTRGGGCGTSGQHHGPGRKPAHLATGLLLARLIGDVVNNRWHFISVTIPFRVYLTGFLGRGCECRSR
jgi:hypothetical protein